MDQRTTITVLAALAGAAVLGLLGVASLVRSGLYDVSADQLHTQAVYTLLEQIKRQSVRRAARRIEERPPPSPAQLRRGAACYRAHCADCHGAPGVAPAAASLTMQPLPGPLTDASRQWRTRELVWIVRHGIRMSAMPAWSARLADDDIWAVVGFVEVLNALSTAEWRRLQEVQAAASCDLRPTGPDAVIAPTARQGRLALQRHGCHGCHMIPGIVGSARHVGPPLAGFGRREWIKGRVPNTPEQLARWIRDPQQIDPHSVMPPSDASPADARVMAAYLLSLR